MFDYCNNAILTPHIGEFKRLVGDFSTDEEKIELQLKFSKEKNVFLILKGFRTSISTPNGDLYFNSTGNSGLSTAGSGDILTGLILSFLSQGYSKIDSSILSVFIHGKSADLALSKESEESMISSDIIGFFGNTFSIIREKSIKRTN